MGEHCGGELSRIPKASEEGQMEGELGPGACPVFETKRQTVGQWAGCDCHTLTSAVLNGSAEL
jgi:hypothetical protein